MLTSVVVDCLGGYNDEKQRRLFGFVLACMMLFCVVSSHMQVPVLADDSISADEIIGADFAHDKVLVVMNSETSRQFKSYDASDFPEANCKNVTVLNDTLGEKVQEKLKQTETAEAAVAFNETASTFMRNLDVDAYKQILCLELEQPGVAQVLSAVELLRKRSDVYAAQLDSYYYAQSEAATITDPLYTRQWGMELSNIPEMWDLFTTTNTIAVGVMDTGIDASHPDLSERVYTSYSRTFLNGANAAGGITDPHGHGTHIAGIIAASRNSTGVCGVAPFPNVKLLSLQVLDSNTDGRTSDIIRAIDYGAEFGVYIFNMSFGHDRTATTATIREYQFQQNEQALYSAMASYPGLFICSAGNNNWPADSYNANYPSEYDLINVMSVGAYSENYTRWYNSATGEGSNGGTSRVDIFAPGGSIMSCYTRTKCNAGSCGVNHSTSGYVAGYHYMSGTSMATPFVTAVAAMVLVQNPGLSSSELITRIVNTANTSSYTSALYNCSRSHGILNAYAALAG